MAGTVPGWRLRLVLATVPGWLLGRLRLVLAAESWLRLVLSWLRLVLAAESWLRLVLAAEPGWLRLRLVLAIHFCHLWH